MPLLFRPYFSVYCSCREIACGAGLNPIALCSNFSKSKVSGHFSTFRLFTLNKLCFDKLE